MQFPGFVNVAPAVAYCICHNLHAAFSQPLNGSFAEARQLYGQYPPSHSSSNKDKVNNNSNFTNSSSSINNNSPGGNPGCGGGGSSNGPISPLASAVASASASAAAEGRKFRYPSGPSGGNTSVQSSHSSSSAASPGRARFRLQWILGRSFGHCPLARLEAF